MPATSPPPPPKEKKVAPPGPPHGHGSARLRQCEWYTSMRTPAAPRGAASITMSYRTNPMGYHWPWNTVERPLVTRFEGNTAYFSDGTQDDFDAVVLCTGATAPRDLPVEGRQLAGIHFAMDFLVQQNKRVAGDDEARAAPLTSPQAREQRLLQVLKLPQRGDHRVHLRGTSGQENQFALRIDRHRRPDIGSAARIGFAIALFALLDVGFQ